MASDRSNGAPRKINPWTGKRVTSDPATGEVPRPGAWPAAPSAASSGTTSSGTGETPAPQAPTSRPIPRVPRGRAGQRAPRVLLDTAAAPENFFLAADPATSSNPALEVLLEDTASAEAEQAAATPNQSARRSKAVALMASGTMVSRVLGFLRTFLLAIAIGATSSVGDAFDKANTIPNIIFMLLAGGIFNVILIPQLIKASKNADKGRDYTSKLMTLTITVMAVLTAILTLLAPVIMRLLASNKWSDELLTLATVFSYWCLPQIFFYGVYAVAGQVLNAHGRFGAYMWAPVANNLIQLLTIGLYLVMFDAYRNDHELQLSTWTTTQTVVLAGGATLGIVVQALVLFIPLRRMGLGLRPDFKWRGMGLRKVGTMALWTLAAMVVGNLTSLYFGRVVSTATAYRNDAGLSLAEAAKVPGEAALNQSQLITVLPHSIFALSLATVMFNELSKAFADGRRQDVGPLVSRGLRTTAIPIMFFTVGFVVLAGPIGRLFGGTGPYSNEAGAAIATLIVLTALGLPAKSYSFYLLRVFYAQEDTKTPMFLQIAFALFGLITAMIVSFTAPPAMLAPCIALLYAAANIFQALTVHASVKRRFGDYGAPSVMDTYIRVGWLAAVSGLVGAGILWLMGGYTYGFAWSGYAPAILSILVAGGAMGVCFLVLLRMARVSELADFLGPLARRIPGGRR
ncbi:MAG: murein biosynthesis integral membrane protein MurJ [Galactobacter sp.]